MKKTYIKAAIAALISIPLFVAAQNASTTGTVSTTSMAMDYKMTYASSSCPFTISFMKLGAENKAEDVLKLQAFLKSYENADVDLNGSFDAKTDDAVKNFQRKYMEEIMGPWDATRPSGIVHVTTVKKINQIVCGNALNLTPDELTIISEYRKNLGVQSGPVQVTPSPASTPTVMPSAPAGPVMTAPTSPSAPSAPKPSASTKPSISPLPPELSPIPLNQDTSSTSGMTDSGQYENAGQSSASNTSVPKRFVNFLRNLF